MTWLKIALKYNGAGAKHFVWYTGFRNYGYRQRETGQERMDVDEARRILGIGAQEDEKVMKACFRQMIRKYHPDAIGSELPEHRRRAQELNEAYRVLKIHYRSNPAAKKVIEWAAPLNTEAYAERNIYVPYSHEDAPVHLRRKAARGKYMWDPDEEEFPDFLRSVAEVSGQLLAEMETAVFLTSAERSKIRFRYQAKLLKLLVQQFMEPLECLEKLAAAESVDADGRSIYRFRSYLGAERGSEAYQNVIKLQNGEIIYPAALQNNRIYVKNNLGCLLGHLSFEDDALYVCIIPLLREKLAQVKMSVRRAETGRRRRPAKAKAEIVLWLRVAGGERRKFSQNGSEDILKLLQAYKRALKTGMNH